MSDIIPPLISSTPPPMPEFDDDEDDDDDDDFGMGTGIGDLGLDFQDAARENKNKILELERNRRVGSNGSQDGWRSNEEQDSASQDSGLCMASHGSEGVSPLPQSDDDERGEMRHSATVIFDSNAVPVPVPDTGRKQKEAASHTKPADLNGVTNQDHDDRSDDEFGNWTVAEDTDNTQFDNFSDPPKKSNDQSCNGTIPNGLFKHCANDEQPSLENTNISKTELSEDASDDIHLNDLQENIPVDNECVNSVRNSNLETSDENSLCADSTVSQATQFECEPRSNENCVDNLSDSDDFGNFESVTVVNHNLNCVDSVEKHEVETNSNLQAVDDDSFGDFGEFSEPVIVDSKLNRNEICESDIRVVETTEEGPSLENNIASSESESVILDKPICQRSSENSTEDQGEERHPADVDEDDDEFNDFSDFTQSQSVENTAVVDGADDDEFDEFSDFTQSQAVEGGIDQVKADNLACGSHSISSQDGFEDIFPKEGPETDDAKTEDLERGPIWQQLCPLESSPALSFQWPNSRAHTKLLSALNIDSRNILFGPKWNAKIPRFAANLGSNPLQPVKASERSPATPPTINLPSEATVQIEPETVPDAHFDWGGSGLTNPLDYAHRTSVHKSEEIVDSNSSKKLNKLDNLRVLSSEAEKIISQLPDLNFMKKTYIEVLISEV